MGIAQVGGRWLVGYALMLEKEFHIDMERGGGSDVAEFRQLVEFARLEAAVPRPTH